MAVTTTREQGKFPYKKKLDDGWPNQTSPALQAEFLSRAFPGGTRKILKDGQQFYLLSLDPLRNGSGKNYFHGYQVLGKTRIRDSKIRSSLLAAFYQDVSKSAHPPSGISPAKSCFIPRHGIRAEQGKKFVDLVICFECSRFDLYTNGNTAGSTILGHSNKLFNQILKQAKVRMAAQ